MSAPLLSISGLQAAYGSSQVVLDGLDLAIGAGEVVALLGRNGMGKTTTVRCIIGWLNPRAGEIRFAGQSIAGLPPEKIARLGVALVPEGRRVFPNLSVRENLTAFARPSVDGESRWTLETVHALFPRLAERTESPGNRLSGGEQQMLAIGRALMTNPKLLILDEATEGLSPLVREEIWSCLRRLRESGQSILVIDKHLNRLIDLADRHVVIEKGRPVWTGSSPELAAAPDVWHRYLGV
jgi:branched-chain amino acid transport system ATP-binding protein